MIFYLLELSEAATNLLERSTKVLVVRAPSRNPIIGPNEMTLRKTAETEQDDVFSSIQQLILSAGFS